MTESDQLSFLADVHVPEAFGNALRSGGFDVVAARTALPQRTDDRTLLAMARDRSDVLLTNDRDFAALHGSVDHAGIVIYTSPSHTAAAFRRGIRLIDRQFSRETIENTLLWLEEWF